MYIATLTVLCPQDGCTALHLAAQEGKVDVVRLLIDTEAQVNTQTEVHTLNPRRMCRSLMSVSMCKGLHAFRDRSNSVHLRIITGY